MTQRLDLVASASLRSQSNINANTVSGPNTSIFYDSGFDAAEVTTRGSIPLTDKVFLNPATYTTGCIVTVHDYYPAAGAGSYDRHAGINDSHKFNMLGEDGAGDKRRLEQRYRGYDSGGTHWLVDTRPYFVGAEEDGIGSGLGKITPWTDPTQVSLGTWHRMITRVDFTPTTPTYTLYFIEEDGTEVTVYDDVELTTVVANGGLDAWTPLWVNTSTSGETVTITNSGTTATVTHTAHELEVGDSIELYSPREANESQYNGPQTIASVVDANTYTYTMSGDPGGSATPVNEFLAMLSTRTHGYMRNLIYLHDTSTIDLAPLKIAPISA